MMRPMRNYAALATKAIAEHGGEFLARGGPRHPEGGAAPIPQTWWRAFLPSLEAANACYESATYQEALGHAQGASERDLVLVEALD